MGWLPAQHEGRSRTRPWTSLSDPQTHTAPGNLAPSALVGLCSVQRIAPVSPAGSSSSDRFDEQQVRSGRVDGTSDRAFGETQALTLDRREEVIDGGVLGLGLNLDYFDSWTGRLFLPANAPGSRKQVRNGRQPLRSRPPRGREPS
jgi:hypothetical protein